MPNEIERLLPRHFAIIDLSLAGTPAVAIAEELGISKQTVYNVQNSPLVQDELARRRKDIEIKSNEKFSDVPAQARRKLEEHALAAAERLGQLAQSNDEAVAHRSSVAILDKVLGKDEQKLRPLVINAEQFQVLQLALEESKQLQEVQAS